MSEQSGAIVGFIGLGTMGEPMARNLLRAGTPLVVWNRTRRKTRVLEEAGADVALDVPDLFRRTSTVILMLSSGDAIDDVLGRGSPGFASRVADHLVVNMGTPSPAYSLELSRDLRSAGCRYIEAPVSGQRGPAEAGRLIVMVAGEREDLDPVKRLLAPIYREIVVCGSVPKALQTKVASNICSITMQVALAETVNYARSVGVDLDVLAELMGLSPMSCDLFKMKLPKLANRDFAVQASLDTVVEAAGVVRTSAGEDGIPIPLLALSQKLCIEAKQFGTGEEDVTAVIRAFEPRDAG